jgi:hypothetical protein
LFGNYTPLRIGLSENRETPQIIAFWPFLKQGKMLFFAKPIFCHRLENIKKKETKTLLSIVENVK